MKVLFTINSYIDEEWERWQNNQELECPAHYLWGATNLNQYDINVDILPYQKYKFLKKLGSQLRLGDLDQQLRVLLRQSDYDLVYSSGQTGSIFLSLLRSVGVFRKPIVVKLERPFANNLWNKILIKILANGHDKILCLSQRLLNQLRDEFDIPKTKLDLLEWGPDLSSYELQGFSNFENQVKESIIARRDSSFIISAGSTMRDFNTIVTAFSEINYPLKIYCSGNSAPTCDISSNVSIQHNHPTEKRALSFKEILMEYRQSYAIAIPLNIPPEMADYSNSFGFTSLLDAMAIGKAVVMTRNKQIDIDIEKEGIGFWVDSGDIRGWKQAITYLLEHPEETQEMGRRSRYFCEHHCNLDIYSSKLAKSLMSIFTAD